MLQATRALERGDREEALQAFREIEALDVAPPAMFAYRYGRMLVEQGAGAADWRKGRSLLPRFAIRAGRGSEHYTSALELLLAANAALEAVESPTRLEERLPDVRRGVDAQLVRVEGGSFAMGCTPEQEGCTDDEKPVRQVRIRSFEITRYESKVLTPGSSTCSARSQATARSIRSPGRSVLARCAPSSNACSPNYAPMTWSSSPVSTVSRVRRPSCCASRRRLRNNA